MAGPAGSASGGGGSFSKRRHAAIFCWRRRGSLLVVERFEVRYLQPLHDADGGVERFQRAAGLHFVLVAEPLAGGGAPYVSRLPA